LRLDLKRAIHFIERLFQLVAFEKLDRLVIEVVGERRSGRLLKEDNKNKQRQSDNK
jgi:hypothetical protein